MHYSFKNILLNSQTLIRQTKHLVMMTEEASTKIVNFMTLGSGILVVGCGHMSYFENALFLFKSVSLLPGLG